MAVQRREGVAEERHQTFSWYALIRSCFSIYHFLRTHRTARGQAETHVPFFYGNRELAARRVAAWTFRVLCEVKIQHVNKAQKRRTSIPLKHSQSPCRAGGVA